MLCRYLSKYNKGSNKNPQKKEQFTIINLDKMSQPFHTETRCETRNTSFDVIT